MATRVRTVVVGPFAVNCYLLWNEATAECVIIDPGDEADRIVEEMDQFNLVPRAILLTHGHGDHIAAVAALKERFELPVYIGQDEERMLADPSANVSAYFDEAVTAPAPDHLVADEQVLKVAGIRLTVLASPGHTAAGVCYLEEEAGRLFSGDTLFAGSVGRTDLGGGDFHRLIKSIRDKILVLPDSVIVYPGHGPRTTVGAERTSNPFLIGGEFA